MAFFFLSFSSFKKAAKFFKEDRSLEDFTFWDYREFVSLWFLLLMISDCLTIIGSVYKVAIDQRVSKERVWGRHLIKKSVAPPRWWNKTLTSIFDSAWQYYSSFQLLLIFVCFAIVLELMLIDIVPLHKSSIYFTESI